MSTARRKQDVHFMLTWSHPCLPLPTHPRYATAQGSARHAKSTRAACACVSVCVCVCLCIRFDPKRNWRSSQPTPCSSGTQAYTAGGRPRGHTHLIFFSRRGGCVATSSPRCPTLQCYLDCCSRNPENELFFYRVLATQKRNCDDIRTPVLR